MSASWDGLVAAAVKRVAGDLNALSRRGIELGEVQHLQPSMRRQLQQLTNDLVDTSEQKLPLPNWRPRPGGLDIGIRRPGAVLPRCAIELKLRELGWTLWDYIKVLDALSLPGVERSYLVVGATEAALGSAIPDRCLELFKPRGCDRLSTTSLFAANRLAWFDLLTGGSARPTSVPQLGSTRLVAREPLRMDGTEAVLLCVAVEPVAEGTRVPFRPDWYCGDWPLGVDAPEQYLRWKRRHWSLARNVRDAGGSMGLPALEAAAKSLGVNYAREFGLHYKGERILRARDGSVRLTDAGADFVSDWSAQFCA